MHTRNDGTSQLETQEPIGIAATQMQRRRAMLFCLVLALISILILPYAQTAYLKVSAFLAYYTAFAMAADLLTTCLLFGQFLSTRTPALAVLAMTYLFSCLIVVPYVLTFPGIFAPTGLFNASIQTANWLWIFWHAGFPLGIIAYVIIDRRYSSVRLRSREMILFPVLLLLATLALLVTLSIVAIMLWPFLPLLIVQGNYSRLNITGVGPAVLVLNVIACALLACYLRRGTVIQLWLWVASVAWFFDVLLNLWSGSRYSLGWYVARINSITAATVVLCVLVYEVSRLYKKIVHQNQQLEQQNNQLAQQNLQQRNFVSVASHEFRTALTTIQGFSEVIQEEQLNAQEIKECIGDICSEAYRLKRLISDMLDTDRMRAGQVKLRSESFDLNKLIEEVTSRMHAVTDVHSLRLDLEPSKQLFWGDSDKLTQVLTNLISNAIKYSPGGGEVLLSSRQEGVYVHIMVQDHGIGIPHEKLEAIFEQYTRVEADTTRYIGGTGLGLSIVREIVTMHGGKVWAESTLGEGGTFHLLLPLAGRAVQEQREREPVEKTH